MEDRDGTLALVDEKSGRQEWSITRATNGKYFITSDRNQQLEDRRGTLGLGVWRGTWQQWNIESTSSRSLSSCPSFMASSAGNSHYILHMFTRLSLQKKMKFMIFEVF